jgi:hypothetical protein
VRDFGSEREAFDYLVGRIADEAKRENIPLSEVERKMLYFSETEWTLPDIASVSAQFNRDYDEDEYERKIAGLISKITSDGCGQNREEQETWDTAVEASAGDHYLQVMLELASSIDSAPPGAYGFAPTLEEPAVRPPHDRLKLWLAAFGVVFCIFAMIAFLHLLSGTRFRAVADWASAVATWVFEDRNRFGLIAVFVVLIFVFGLKLKHFLRKRLDKE